TRAGSAFVAHARRLLEANLAALRSLDVETPRPVLRVGFSEYFKPDRLGRLVRRLNEDWPGYRFELRVAQSQLLERELAAKRLDLAVVAKLSRTRRAEPGAEPLHWVGSPELTLPQSDPLALVLLPPDCALRGLVCETLTRLGVGYHVAVTCSGTAGVHAALRGQLGIGCLNESAIPDDLSIVRDPRLPKLPRMRFAWLAQRGPAKRIADALSE